MRGKTPKKLRKAPGLWMAKSGKREGPFSTGKKIFHPREKLFHLGPHFFSNGKFFQVPGLFFCRGWKISTFHALWLQCFPYKPPWDVMGNAKIFGPHSTNNILPRRVGEYLGFFPPFKYWKQKPLLPVWSALDYVVKTPFFSPPFPQARDWEEKEPSVCPFPAISRGMVPPRPPLLGR